MSPEGVVSVVISGSNQELKSSNTSQPYKSNISFKVVFLCSANQSSRFCFISDRFSRFSFTINRFFLLLFQKEKFFFQFKHFKHLISLVLRFLPGKQKSVKFSDSFKYYNLRNTVMKITKEKHLSISKERSFLTEQEITIQKVHYK